MRWNITRFWSLSPYQNKNKTHSGASASGILDIYYCARDLDLIRKTRLKGLRVLHVELSDEVYYNKVYSAWLGRARGDSDNTITEIYEQYSEILVELEVET